MYKSETAKVRHLATKYCFGNGVDIGAGGDKIVPSAISIDLENPYAVTGNDEVQLKGDGSILTWFTDESLDYIYSSHLLEDFDDKALVLFNWQRVIKVGGFIVLFLPDEQLYRKHCEANNAPINTHHKDPDFNMCSIERIVTKQLSNLKIIDVAFPVVDYSFFMVIQKMRLL